MTEQNKGHIDIIGSLGGTQFFLGHADISGEQYSHQRFRDIANLLHTIAWQLEDEADKFDGWTPRCLKNSLGDLFFEVAPDVFVDADDRREAEVLYLANSLTTTEAQLRGYYPDLLEVTE